MCNARVYWVCAPGIMIAGLSGNPWTALLLFALYRTGVYTLVPWFVLGMCLSQTPVAIPDTLHGTVSLVTENNMHIIEDGTFKVWRVQTHEPVSAGSKVSVQITNNAPLVTPRSQQNHVKLVKYLHHERQISTFRQQIYSRCYESMNHDSASIASALIIGVSDMAPEVRQNFVNSGLSHLLAISGLHVNAIAGCTWWIMRRVLVILLPSVSEALAIITALVIGIYYSILSGCGISILRSLVMFGITLALWYNGRSGDPVRTCGLVACILLSLYPHEWHSPGFVLSFIATATLLTCPGLVQITTAPYILYFFNQLPLEPFCSNLLAIPWTVFVIMPLVVLNMIFSCKLYFLMKILELATFPLLFLIHYIWSPLFYWGMIPDLGIGLWTVGLFMFFATRQFKWILYGSACFCTALYFAEPQGSIAMRYNKIFGVYDNGILWASHPDSYITKQWSQALGHVSIIQMDDFSVTTQSGKRITFNKNHAPTDEYLQLKNNESEWRWLERKRYWYGHSRK